MIILIAGSTHAGKTLFAQKLLEAYSYPYLSIDQLKMGLIRSGPARLLPPDGQIGLGKPRLKKQPPKSAVVHSRPSCGFDNLRMAAPGQSISGNF